VSAWVNEEAKWREKWEKTNSEGDRTSKRARQTEHPQITEMMDLWVSKAMGDGILLTGEFLRQKWTKFADLVGIPQDERLNLSNGWLARYKGRNGLKELKRHGEAASADSETVERERERIQELIKKCGYKLQDIFNMDETGLFYAYAPIF
jgi:Tc5 transposase DNA-binding domain